jgi:archaellum component FlaD/FlaE
MVDLKKVLGKKKEEEQQDDTIIFDVSPEKLQDASNQQRTSVQSFTVTPEKPSETPQKEKPPNESVIEAQVSSVGEDESTQGEEPTVVNEQLQDLSNNLKNLVYDFRSFMSEAGSPFNPNDIPAKPESKVETGRSGPGYISAQIAGAGETEAVENPSDVESGFENKFVSPIDKLRLSKLLEQPKKSSHALKQFNEVLNAQRATKFSKDLKSNLDSTDMPALIRAVNSTDYLLHAVGRKNLLKILEVGTREGWIRPEVERLVLSVTEVLSTAGADVDDRTINVNDLLRVVYFLNRLLDPEISDFLSMNPTPRARTP